MSKREQYILIAMVLILAGVGGFYFVDSGSQGPSFEEMVNEPELDQAITTANAIASKEQLSEMQLTRLERLIPPCFSKNPVSSGRYHPGSRAFRADEEYFVQPGDLFYTGYIEQGDVKLAIINGLEYETGEQTEIDGLFVVGIESEHVKLGYRDGANYKNIFDLERSAESDKLFK